MHGRREESQNQTVKMFEANLGRLSAHLEVAQHSLTEKSILNAQCY